ncbi:RNA chaperone Hfq [Paenibacillus sp. YN15]|nr:RNA chaperone Hfq [Paenibacillus sp. YN15]
MILLQEHQLSRLRKERSVCTIITINGARMKGVIDHFDKYVVLISESSGRSNMIFKHAISTIVEEKTKATKTSNHGGK